MDTLIGNQLTEAHESQFLWFVHFFKQPSKIENPTKGLDHKTFRRVLLCSIDCVFMHLTFPIINTVKEETVVTALLRTKPQHHFSFNTFLFAACIGVISYQNY